LRLHKTTYSFEGIFFFEVIWNLPVFAPPRDSDRNGSEYGPSILHELNTDRDGQFFQKIKD